MKKQALPNLITFARIVCAVVLLFVPLGPVFAALYVACGLTDMLDGFLARRLGAQTAFGARLDSAADLLFLCAALVRLWPLLSPGAGVLAWVAGIAALRLAAALAARLRFGRFGFLHTLGNKLTGLLLFLYPLSLPFVSGRGPMYALCAVASLSAAEELAIQLTAPAFHPNRRGLWQRGTKE